MKPNLLIEVLLFNNSTDVLGCLQVTMVMCCGLTVTHWPAAAPDLVLFSLHIFSSHVRLQQFGGNVTQWRSGSGGGVDADTHGNAAQSSGWQQLLPLRSVHSRSEWFSLLSFLWSKWTRVWMCSQSHDHSPTVIISGYCQNIDQISASHGLLIFTV